MIYATVGLTARDPPRHFEEYTKIFYKVVHTGKNKTTQNNLAHKAIALLYLDVLKGVEVFHLYLN